MQTNTDEYLRNCLNRIEKKKNELEFLKDLLSSLENKILPIKDDIKNKEIEIEKLKKILNLNDYGESEIVTLRLGDLIDELSQLSGIDKSNIEARFFTNIEIIGKKPVEKSFLVSSKVNNDSRIMSLSLSGGKLYRDNYFIYTYCLDTPMNLDEIQADGKTLYDHCEAVWGHIEDMEWKDIYTYLAVYYDLDDIICHFDLNRIMAHEESKNSLYPKKLLTRAILNCAFKNPERNLKGKQKGL